MDLSKARVNVTSDQVSSELDGEEVILNLKDGTYYGLNEVGARIWALLQEAPTLLQVRDQIVEEFDVEAEQCEQDLVTLVQELEDAGLVTIQSNPSETRS
jgi:hypothetical protein